MFRGRISNPLRLRSVHVLPKQQRPLRSLLHGVSPVSPITAAFISRDSGLTFPIFIVAIAASLLGENDLDYIARDNAFGSDALIVLLQQLKAPLVYALHGFASP